MENLKIENVTKEYRESALLDNVTFDLEKGKVYGLLGKNGAGKTTLLKIIVKLIPMDNYKGRVKILDSEKKISALISDPSCYMNLTVKDNLKLYSFLFYDRKVAREEAICKMIDDFRLKTMINQKVRSLSLGMLQKLKLALTFMPSTSILILDEPFNGLDIEGVLLLKEKINEAKNMGKTIMITSHNTEQLANLCDNFVILHESRIYSVSKNQIKDNSLEDIYCNILLEGNDYVS